MGVESLIIIVVIGAVAGWLAGQVMKGKGFGLLGNIVVGVIGAFVGGFVFNLLGISVGGGLLGPLITAFAGAVILLWVVSLLK